ncbi:hypothetical protein AMTRI_Chr01g126880 [Amborella trichopoda]
MSPHQNNCYFCDPRKLPQKALFAGRHPKAPRYKIQEGWAEERRSIVTGKDGYKHFTLFNGSLYITGLFSCV